MVKIEDFEKVDIAKGSVSGELSRQWTSSSTLTDETVLSLCEDALSVPTLVTRPYKGTKALPEQKLYSEARMIEMFRKGFTAAMSLNASVAENVAHALDICELPPRTAIREMKPGDVLVFRYDQWSAVRSAVSDIRSVYGGTFNTHKLGRTGEIGNIIVSRIDMPS